MENYNFLNNQNLIQSGQTSSDVGELQNFLQTYGFNSGGTAQDNIFGNQTSQSVQNFQQQQGIGVDGIVGPETRAAMQAYLAQQGQNAGQMPSGQTAGDIYGTLDLSGVGNPQMDSLMSEYQNYYRSFQNPNEQEVRQNTLDKFQAQIDAVNAMYAQELERAKVAGRGRLGSNTAIQSRRGLIGSDFGEAQTQGQENANEENYRMIEQERLARIAGIMTQAESDAAAAIAEKRRAYESGLEARLAYAQGEEERRAANKTKAASLLFDQGLSPDEVSPADLEQLARAYGISVADVRSSYKNELAAQQEALRQQQLAENPDLTIKEGEDFYRYNPQTGQYELTASKAKTFAPKSSSTGSGSTGSGSTGSGSIGSNVVNELKDKGYDLNFIVNLALSGFGGTAAEREAIRNQVLNSDDPFGALQSVGVQKFSNAQLEKYDSTYNEVIPQLSQAVALIENSDIEFNNPTNLLRNFRRTLGKDSPEYEAIKFLLEGVNAPIRNQIFGASLTEGEKTAANAFLIDTQKDSREAILNKARGIMATQDMAAQRTALTRAGFDIQRIQQLVNDGFIPSYNDFLAQYGVNPAYITGGNTGTPTQTVIYQGKTYQVLPNGDMIEIQ